MIRIILLTIIVLTTSSCTHHVQDAPSELNHLALHDRRPIEIIETDQTIEQDGYEELQEQAELTAASMIRIKAYNKTVLVAGVALNQKVKNDIITTIRNINDVKLVHDHIALEQLPQPETLNNDEQINNAILSALNQIQTLPDFESQMVKVVTVQSTAYLMGQLHRNEGQVVINVVRHVPNINKIIALFEYLD